MADKKAATYRLTEQVRKIIKRVSDQANLSETRVVEIAVLRLNKDTSYLDQLKKMAKPEDLD